MFQGKIRIAFLLAVIALSVAAQAYAQDKGCIVLKSVAEVEQEVVNDKGEKAKKLVPVSKAVPGVEVIWTITAQRYCNNRKH